MLNRIKFPCIRRPQTENGQSLILLALMFVGLLAFMGLAIDVGFIYVRQAQLTAAVDAAALAGVSELTSPGMLPVANLRAAEFMHAHDLPSVVITRTFDNPANYSEGLSVLGARQYSITATWPVDLFFLRVIGRDTFSVTKSATAAQFPLADIYASRRVEDAPSAPPTRRSLARTSASPMGTRFPRSATPRRSSARRGAAIPPTAPITTAF